MMGKKCELVRLMVLAGINVTVVFYSVGIIASLLFVSVQFENKEVRHNPSGQAPPNDSLALAMTVDQLRNYFNNVPDAHLIVSQEQMTDFWFLPPGTSLSPLMKSIARCRMAADVNRVECPEVCNRVQVPWPWMVMIVAVVNVVDIVWGGHMNRVIKNDDAMLMKLMLHALFHTVIWYALFAVLNYVPSFRNNYNIGMLYTLPGEIYPQPFYPVFPVLFCMINCGLKATECFWFIVCIWIKHPKMATGKVVSMTGSDVAVIFRIVVFCFLITTVAGWQVHRCTFAEWLALIVAFFSCSGVCAGVFYFLWPALGIVGFVALVVLLGVAVIERSPSPVSSSSESQPEEKEHKSQGKGKKSKSKGKKSKSKGKKSKSKAKKSKSKGKKSKRKAKKSKSKAKKSKSKAKKSKSKAKKSKGKKETKHKTTATNTSTKSKETKHKAVGISSTEKK